MPHIIDTEECYQCGSCESECPHGAIIYLYVDGEFWIDPKRCRDCENCEELCVSGAIHRVEEPEKRGSSK